jgi:hypothetical protein
MKTLQLMDRLTRPCPFCGAESEPVNRDSNGVRFSCSVHKWFIITFESLGRNFQWEDERQIKITNTA